MVAALNGNPHNRRVKATQPWAWEAGVLTAAQLSNMRATFWEAQTSGRRVVFENLKVVSEALLQGDVPLANALLDAADIRVPNADLSVAYDSLGHLYQVPRYCYSTPTNVVSEEEAAALARKNVKAHVGPVSSLPVILRLSASLTNQEQDVKMEVRSNETAAEVKAALHERLRGGECDQPVGGANNAKPNVWLGRGLPPARQRVMYRGRELPDTCHMQEAGVQPGGYLQVFVRPE